MSTAYSVETSVNHVNSVNLVNSVNHVDRVRHVNSVNSVNSGNSVSSYSAVLPPSLMLLFTLYANKHRQINHRFLSTSAWKREIPVKPLSGLWLDFEPPAHHATLCSLLHDIDITFASQSLEISLWLVILKIFGKKSLKLSTQMNWIPPPIPYHVTRPSWKGQT